MPVLLLLILDGTIPGGDCGTDEGSQIEKDVNRDERLANRRWIEGMRLAHPLRDESLLTGLGNESKVWRTLGILLRTDSSPLAVQRMKRIEDSNVPTLMMGSMQDLCLADRPRC